MIKIFFVIALIGLSFVAPTAMAGGRVGTGGDSLENMLEDARKKVVETLVHISKNPEQAGTILFETACARARMLDEEQRRMCADFVLETAQLIAHCNGDAKRPALRAKNADYPEEFVADYGDGPRPVEAKTEPGCHSAIFFHYQAIRDHSPRALMMLIMHEMGHKIKFRGDYVYDAGPMEPFNRGEELLNAAASAVVLYGIAVKTIPMEVLTALAKKKDWFECAIDFPEQQKVSFRSNSTRLESTDLKSYISKNDWDDSAGFDITRWTARFYPLEKFYLRMAIQEKGGCEVDDPGDSTTFSLLRKASRGYRIISGEVLDYNALCEMDFPSELSANSPEHGLTVTCSYSGYHRY